MESIDEQINSKENHRSQKDKEQDNSHALLLPSEVRRIKLLRQYRSLTALINDKAAAQPERERAMRILESHRKELYESYMLIKIDKQIRRIEEQKHRLKVQGLSFNAYYEFALERILQITAMEKIRFDIRGFAALLKQFYRGGELEHLAQTDVFRHYGNVMRFPRGE